MERLPRWRFGRLVSLSYSMTSEKEGRPTHDVFSVFWITSQESAFQRRPLRSPSAGISGCCLFWFSSLVLAVQPRIYLHGILQRDVLILGLRGVQEA